MGHCTYERLKFKVEKWGSSAVGIKHFFCCSRSLSFRRPSSIMKGSRPLAYERGVRSDAVREKRVDSDALAHIELESTIGEHLIMLW